LVYANSKYALSIERHFLALSEHVTLHSYGYRLISLFEFHRKRMKATHLKAIFIYTNKQIVPYSKLPIGLNITLTLFSMGKRYGVIY
jgi:hypothetical protein